MATRALQSLLPCALASSWPKVRPIFLVFASRHLGQVFFDLFPWWFRVKACLVMLVTACAQSILAFFFRFLAFVENFLQRQMLLLSGNDIWRILLRQLLIIVCTLLSTVFVILNISAPYKALTWCWSSDDGFLFFCHCDKNKKFQMFLSSCQSLLWHLHLCPQDWWWYVWDRWMTAHLPGHFLWFYFWLGCACNGMLYTHQASPTGSFQTTIFWHLTSVGE